MCARNNILIFLKMNGFCQIDHCHVHFPWIWNNMLYSQKRKTFHGFSVCMAQWNSECFISKEVFFQEYGTIEILCFFSEKRRCWVHTGLFFILFLVNRMPSDWILRRCDPGWLFDWWPSVTSPASARRGLKVGPTSVYVGPTFSQRLLLDGFPCRNMRLSLQQLSPGEERWHANWQIYRGKSLYEASCYCKAFPESPSALVATGGNMLAS